MSTTQHTPGPWNVEHPYGEPGVYVASPNTGLVAKLYAPDAPANIEANAHLIAAAPELLSALREVMRFADGKQHTKDAQTGESVGVVWAKARAAIFKAEGAK